MPTAPMERDLYSELEVTRDATTEEIKAQYRRLCLAHHPDKVPTAQKDQATERLAAINTAWDVLGDTDRRRVYDMQCDAHGRKLPWPARVKRLVLGTGARSFRWSSGMPYLRKQSLGQLHRQMQAGKPSLLFVHLGGSARSTKSAAAIIEARRRLRGAVFVAAVDAEAEPELAEQLGRGDDLPKALLVRGRGDSEPAQFFDAPLNASTLVDAATDALPSLPNACTANQWFAALRAAGGGASGSRTRRSALVLAMRPAWRAVARVGCAAADGRLLCRSVPHMRCDALPAELLACKGLALISSPKPDGSGAVLRQCFVGGGEPDTNLADHQAALAVLRAHAARAQFGRVLAPFSVGAYRATNSPPAHALSAISAAIVGAPLAAPARLAASLMLRATLTLVSQGPGPVAIAALGLIVLLGRSAARASIHAETNRWARRGRGRRVRSRARQRVRMPFFS